VLQNERIVGAISYIEEIKSRMMLFRENSTFLRSLASPAQVVVRFEGSQARQNGYLVFRRSNPELSLSLSLSLSPLFRSSRTHANYLPVARVALHLQVFVSETSKYWWSLLKRRRIKTKSWCEYAVLSLLIKNATNHTVLHIANTKKN